MIDELVSEATLKAELVVRTPYFDKQCDVKVTQIQFHCSVKIVNYEYLYAQGRLSPRMPGKFSFLAHR